VVVPVVYSLVENWLERRRFPTSEA
jgi:hypothetical protein